MSIANSKNNIKEVLQGTKVGGLVIIARVCKDCVKKYDKIYIIYPGVNPDRYLESRYFFFCFARIILRNIQTRILGAYGAPCPTFGCRIYLEISSLQ